VFDECWWVVGGASNYWLGEEVNLERETRKPKHRGMRIWIRYCVWVVMV
jgi:hypothetical protein